MYHVGFGDSFLVTLSTPSGPRHILIDCGVHVQGQSGFLKAIVDDIVATTEKKLALLVMTHVHQDHISGFGTFADQFREFDVGAVWMPWTEDPDDADAQRIHGKRLALAATLQARVAERAKNDAAKAAAPETVARLQNLTGHTDPQPDKIALKSNAVALDLLRGGFRNGAKVSYYGAGDRPKLPDELTGVQVSLLGPPRTPEFLAQMDPPADEHYLHMAGPDSITDPPVRPFGESWQTTAQAYAQLYANDADAQLARDAKRLRDSLPDATDSLALSLDNAVNNTSLVFVLSFAGKNLLFAGDAQWGNWKSWLYSTDPDTRGRATLSENAKQVLSNLHFYKVAHHGSVNATPVDAVEGLADGCFAAMCSTQNTPWKSIPRIPLVERLQQKSKDKLVRSDDVPKDLPTGFSAGGDGAWVDYEL